MNVEERTGQPTLTSVSEPSIGWHQAIERTTARVMAVSRWLTILGGLMIVGVGGIICVEITLRKVFNTTTGVADEISTYVLAIASALAFSHCLMERAHIRIDSAMRFLPVRIRTVIDLVALASLTGFFATVTWFGAETAWISYSRGSRAVTQLQTPLFIPQGLWAAGLALFVLVGVFVFIAALGRLQRGDLAGARELTSTRSEIPDEEVGL